MTPLEQKFVERFGPEPHCNCNPRNLDSECPIRRQLWAANHIGYLAGREDFLQALRVCSICGTATEMACSDCQIDLQTTVYICGKQECRDAHDQKCLQSYKQTLREFPGDEEEQRIRSFSKSLQEYSREFEGETMGILNHAATDLTTLLDQVKALRLRIAELEAKEEPHGR